MAEEPKKRGRPPGKRDTKKTRASFVTEFSVAQIKDKRELLKSTLTKKLNPPQLEEEPDEWYARFLTYCQLGGRAYGLARYYALFKTREANVAGKPVPEIKDAPSSWKEACAKWKWNPRYMEWQETLMAIDLLDRRMQTEETLRIVEKQVLTLDNAFNSAECYLQGIGSLPLEDLKPTLRDVPTLMRAMVEITKLRQAYIVSPDKQAIEIDKAIATLVEADLLPDEVAQRANQNLAEFYEKQKAVLNPNDVEL